jgi:hypothetical protein
MKAPTLLAVPILVILLQACFAQDFGEDVDNLTLVPVSPTISRLSWTGPTSVECESFLTYSVFRGTREDFQPSLSNRIASGLTRMTFLAKESVPSKEYYYLVRAISTPTPCALRSGEIVAYPLPRLHGYQITNGNRSEKCATWSTTELMCEGSVNVGSELPDFHAFIAAQDGHEYLLGCDSYQFKLGDWSCADLAPGRSYSVVVHDGTVSVLDSGLSKVNVENGKSLGSVTPVFSVLARIR